MAIPIHQNSVGSSSGRKTHVGLVQDKQALMMQRVSDLLTENRSPGNQFNDPSSSDIKLTLSSKDGFTVSVNVHRQILVAHSRFFAVKLSERWVKKAIPQAELVRGRVGAWQRGEHHKQQFKQLWIMHVEWEAQIAHRSSRVGAATIQFLCKIMPHLPSTATIRRILLLFSNGECETVGFREGRCDLHKELLLYMPQREDAFLRARSKPRDS